MPKRFIKIFIPIFLAVFFLAGVVILAQAANDRPSSLPKPSCMDDRNPHAPQCPLCPSFSSINPCPYPEAAAYLPTPISSFILLSENTLSDQEVTKTIFHPPISES
jgi:hypothetical protein